MSTSHYDEIYRGIDALNRRVSASCENSIIILTMRTQFHQQVKNTFRETFGQAYFLQPFSPSDIYDFLLRWPFDANRQSNIDRIYGDLTDKPTLREIAATH